MNKLTWQFKLMIML